jgi:hypothetical protein
VSLDVDRMTDRALWNALEVTLYRLDPQDISYAPGQLHNLAVEGVNIVLELRKRGTQFSLLPPAS